MKKLEVGTISVEDATLKVFEEDAVREMFHQRMEKVTFHVAVRLSNFVHPLPSNGSFS
jgi:hypothetical protein